jgi:hypothetical protein
MLALRCSGCWSSFRNDQSRSGLRAERDTAAECGVGRCVAATTMSGEDHSLTRGELNETKPDDAWRHASSGAAGSGWQQVQKNADGLATRESTSGSAAH